MGVESDQPTSICSHCERAIPSSNIDLHHAHCSRNLERCKICAEMIPKRFAEEHFLNTHAPVSCSLCSETMDRECLPGHTDESCLRRIVTCVFCEFPLPAVDLSEHQEVCGNRTELCHLCDKYVRLREQNEHEARCNGASDNTNNVAPPRRYARTGASDDNNVPRGGMRGFSRGRILFTIAITGIAVILGSFLLQGKKSHEQVHP